MKPMCEEFVQSPDSLLEEARASMRPPRILLAEDDFEMRRLLADALVKLGYSVIQVADGEALAETLIRHQAAEELDGIDLVVSDVRMPGRSGLEVLDRVRSTDWQVRFVFMSAFGDDAVHAEAYRLGAVVLDKPFKVSELLARVVEVVPPRRYETGWSGTPSTQARTSATSHPTPTSFTPQAQTGQAARPRSLAPPTLSSLGRGGARAGSESA